MAGEGTDILMKVVQGGQALATGVGIDVTTGDVLLLDGFEDGKCSFLTGFSMGASGTKPTGARKEKKSASTNGDEDDDRAERKQKFVPGTPQAVTFKRRLDALSPLLLQGLATGAPLASVTIVKRKHTGGATSGDAFLRLDFTSVLLVSLDWSDDEEGVEEEGKFVYLDLKVQYRAQAANGRLGKAVPGVWPVLK